MPVTTIEWCRNDDGTEGKSWNVVRGCSPVSPGCTNCYAQRMAGAPRLSGPGKAYEGLTRPTKRGPRWTGKVRLVPDALLDPIGWRKPTRVFVNSMSDTFHDDVPDGYIAAIFGVMAACPQHTFIVLTKRAERLRRWFKTINSEWGSVSDGNVRACVGWLDAFCRRCFHVDYPPWPLPNVILGVTAENQEMADARIPDLLAVPAACRMVSVEPMLGPIELRAPKVGWPPEKTPTHPIANPKEWDDWKYWSARDRGVQWLIVGSESGPGARPIQLDWVRSLRDQCQAAKVPFFYKQGSGPDGKLQKMPLLDGLRWAQYPEMPR